MQRVFEDYCPFKRHGVHVRRLRPCITPHSHGCGESATKTMHFNLNNNVFNTTKKLFSVLLKFKSFEVEKKVKKILTFVRG